MPNRFLFQLTAVVVSFLLVQNVNATLIDNGSVTTDDVNGLEWLDVSETRGDSIADTHLRISSGDLMGWRYANSAELTLLFEAAGAVGPFDGWSALNEGLADPLTALWGRTFDDGSVRSILAFTADINNVVLVEDSDISHPGEDRFDLTFGYYGDPYPEIGHALVRNVPEPSVLALFVASLFGVWRYKKFNS